MPSDASKKTSRDDSAVTPIGTLVKPGLHSYNIHRKMGFSPEPPRRKKSWLRLSLLLIALACLGYYGFAVGNRYVYQAYENWAFDQEISGRPSTTKDWLMQTTSLGEWTGYKVPQAPRTAPAIQSQSTPPTPAVGTPEIREGDLLGRLEIPRLGLSSIVREGVSEATLSHAVGHVPSTQTAGAPSNFAIAAHRDTLFRALKDIKAGDTVTFRSAEEEYAYQVTSTKIVKPSDVSVLLPQGSDKLLTMITCYPFYYVGSAPKRFIVTARLMSEKTAAEPAPAESSSAPRR
jgi:sortase A